MEKNSEPKDKESTNQISNFQSAFISLSLIIFIIWLITFAIIFHKPYDKTGPFGDSFGAINALFTGLALAAVVATLFVQRADLITSLNELKLSTKALEAQAVASTQLIEETKIERLERRASIYREFSSESMLKARTDFWIIATRDYFINKQVREIVTYYQRVNSIFGENGIEYEENISLPDGRTASVRDILTWCSHIVEFYAFLSRLYKDSEELSEVAKTYYYDWWRGFLISYTQRSYASYQKLTQEGVATRAQLFFDPNIIELDILEKKLQWDIFDPKVHPCYKAGYAKFANQMPDLFPGPVNY